MKKEIKSSTSILAGSGFFFLSKEPILISIPTLSRGEEVHNMSNRYPILSNIIVKFLNLSAEFLTIHYDQIIFSIILLIILSFMLRYLTNICRKFNFESEKNHKEIRTNTE